MLFIFFRRFQFMILNQYCLFHLRLRVFENMILRGIIGPKKDENGEWRRLNNEELHSLYCSPDIYSG